MSIEKGLSKQDRIRQSWSKYLSKVQLITNKIDSESDKSNFVGLVTTIPMEGNIGIQMKRYIGIVEHAGRYHGVSQSVEKDSDEEKRILGGKLTDEEKKKGISILASLVSGNDDNGTHEVVGEVIETMDFLSEKEQKSIKPNLTKAWTKKISDFVQSIGVDVRALKIISNEMFGEADIQSYSYYAGVGLKKDIAEDNEILNRRIEAANHYPSLVNMMSHTMSIRAAVDTSGPLAQTILAASPIGCDGKSILNKWLLKRLANNEFTTVKPTLRTFEVLSKLPPDWYPSDDKQMQACIDIIENFSDLYAGDTKILLNNCNGKWVDHKNSILLAFVDDRSPEGASREEMEYLDQAIDFKALQKISRQGEFEKVRMVAAQISQSIPMTENLTPELVEDYITRKYAPYDGDGALQMLAETAHNIINTMARRLVLPMVMNESKMKFPNIPMDTMENIKETARKMLMEGKTPVVAMRGFRKLKNVEGLLNSVGGDHIEESLEIIGEESGFYTLSASDIQKMKEYEAWNSGKQGWNILSGPFQIGDYCLVPLVSANDIYDESRKMSHCIGDYYVTQSAEGLSFNYSLRKKLEDGTIMPVATIELLPQANSISLNQVKGFQNSQTIPASAINVLSLFKKDVLTELNKSSVNSRLRQQWKKARLETAHGQDHKLLYSVNYNWRDTGNIEKVHELFSDFFSKPYKKSFETLMDSEEFKKMVLNVNSMRAVEFMAKKKSPSMTMG